MPRRNLGCGCLQRSTRERAEPDLHGSPEKQSLASKASPVSRPWFLGSRIHRPARSIEPCRPPSGSDPANGAFHERLERQSPASHVGTCEASCPRPLSAAPRTSRALCPPSQEGSSGRSLGDACFRFRQWTRLLQCLSRRVGSCGVLPLIETLSGSSSRRRWLNALRPVRAYERFTSGETLRCRNAFGPSLLRALLCVPVARCAPGVVLVSVAELGTALTLRLRSLCSWVMWIYTPPN